MKRSVILISAILFAAPALAEGGGSAMSGGSMNHMSGESMNHMAGTPANCQSMLDEAKPKMDAMAESAMKTKAMHEMTMAHQAMDKGHASSCMSHMHKAIGMMK